MAAAAADEDIDLLIQDVLDASRIPPKARPTSIKPTVARLCSLAYEHGLAPASLTRLAGELLAAPQSRQHLDQASLQALARNLYPRAGGVSADAALQVVGALGHGAGRAALGVQAALLRWLVLVWHVLEDEGRSALSRAYGVLFGVLDTAAIRPQVAHVLALLTRRKHVRPFRIQALLNLSRQTGNDPCLVGLLRVYKDYYPEIIVGEAHPDPIWRAKLDEIREAHAQRHAEAPSATAKSGFRVNRPVQRTARGKLVPIVHTSHATEDSVTLEEVEGVDAFVRSLDRLELPNQLVAVLADPLLQKLLVLRPSAEADRRVANWLAGVLREVADGDADEETLWEVLEVVREYVAQTKALPPVLLSFFARFLELWGGEGRRDLVLDILAYTPLLDFQELYPHIFQPLEAAVQDNSPDTLLALLRLYTNLLHHWVTILHSASPVPAHADAAITALVRHVNTLALTLLQTAGTSGGNHNDDTNDQSSRTNSVAIESAILTFYEQTTPLVTHPTLRQYVRIQLPPSTLVYDLFFSASLASVSRLCRILAAYKRGFETAMTTRPAGRRDSSARDSLGGPGGGAARLIDASTYPKTYVNGYNGFLMDMCNCLWRARAFGLADANSRGCLVAPAVVAALTAYVPAVDRAFSLASLLSLSHAPLLARQSILRVRELEDEALDRGGGGGRGGDDDEGSIRARHAGPVTQDSLAKLAAAGGLRLSWQEYRIEVLEALSARGLPGVTELLKNTMTVLKNSMEGRSAVSQGTSSQATAASQRTASQRTGMMGTPSQ
ncbi:Mis6 domain-containing protein [Purpureocillium lilacinum]|uniref:Mis6 domain-containing protein n=1 Tax=Purpureocillium lilacinum TaxID=33203 RepID=A0A179H6C4_PURLI|nr:Mis6 domain-containing protein [Purpureocillium lilacinum]OAQ85482.1 Mis6 domain-containing protein [Purpureocillium lilacinum]GJN75235.1 hypothetical protein PLICBS_009332 [Purpureocillium lilacinum]